MIEINNSIVGSNNIALRKVYIKPWGFDKLYMDLLEDKCFRMIDQFNERKIKSVMFYSILQYCNTY